MGGSLSGELYFTCSDDIVYSLFPVYFDFNNTHTKKNTADDRLLNWKVFP